MILDSLIIIDDSGVPLASYPKEINVESNVMSGLLSSFLSGIEQLGLGAVESIKIGGKNFVVKRLKGGYIVVVLNKDDETAKWFINILANAIEKYFDIFKSDKGIVLDEEFEAFRKILRDFYEGYSKFKEVYSELSDLYIGAKKLLGQKALEILNTVFGPDIKLVGKNGLGFEEIGLDDLDRVINLMRRGIEKLKENIKEML